MDKQRKTFLSYSRVNKDFAIRLAQELKAEGFDLWLDQLDIPPGAWWDDEVERALEECEIFMVIVTPSSSASKNVKDEIGYALDTNKRILPILLENATLPLRLRRLQYVDFTAKGFDEGVNAAKDLLRRLMAQPTLPSIELSEEERQQLTQADVDRRAKEEAERIAAEKAEVERIDQQKVDEERVAKAKAEEERLSEQRAEEEQLAKARTDREAQAEAERKTRAESRRKSKGEAERLAAQKAEEERLVKQRQEAELAAKAEAEKIAAQKAEDERLARIESKRTAKQEVERLAKQKADEELAAKARADREAKAETERKAKEEAERLSRKQAGKAQVPAEIMAVPVTAEAAQRSAAVPTAPRKPIARGLIYAAVAFVLLCGGIGFGILSVLRNQTPSAALNTVANTPAKTPTDIPERLANPTNTSIPIPEPTAVPSRTPEPTSLPTEIEVVNFTLQGPWKNVTNCPENKEPCWSDSPGGPYANDMYHAITSPEISVDETWGNPYLVYWQKYNTEGQYDFVQIKINDVAVRTNSGTTEWHQIAVALESYKGQEIIVQFLMATDYSIVGDGWYLHDIRVVPNATSQQLQSARIVEP